MATDKQTTGLAKWTDKHFIDLFTLTKSNVADIRTTALDLFRDADNQLKEIRQGKPVPDKLNNNFGKEYVEAVAKKLERAVKNDGIDLRQKCPNENKLLDGLRAFVITAVSRDREKRARASKGKAGSAPATPRTPGKNTSAAESEESEEDAESEDDKPPPKKARTGPKPAKTPSEESDAESVAASSAVKSSTTSKMAKKTVPGFKAPSDSVNSNAGKTNVGNGRTAVHNTTSLDDELLALAGEDIQTGVHSPVASTRFPINTVHEGIGGLSPEKLRRLTGAVIDAANTVGRDMTEKLVAHTDTGERAVTDAAIETLTNTLLTVSRSRSGKDARKHCEQQGNLHNEKGDDVIEEPDKKMEENSGVTDQVSTTYDQSEKQYGPINIPATTVEKQS